MSPDPGISSTASGVRDGDLAALLSNVEQAPHGSISLDLDVMDAVWPTWTQDTITDDANRYVTSSLDAALALCERVLPGCWPAIDRVRHGDAFKCWQGCVEIYPAPRWSVFEAEAKTPALALLCAMLKALIAKETA